MSLWLVLAFAGGLLCLVGLVRLGGALRRGRISTAYFVAAVVVVFSLVAYAVLDGLTPGGVSGPPALAALLPGCVALVVLLREYRRTPMRPH